MTAKPPYSIGFLGAGQMALALAKGWLSAGLVDVSRSLAGEPNAATAERFHRETTIPTTSHNSEVLAKCEIIILAVKPQVLPGVLAAIRSSLREEQLVVSIAAGVTIAQLVHHLGSETRIVRVMPNTPCLVGASATAYTLSPGSLPTDGETAATLFRSVGLAYEVSEHQLDGVTGLSGSGPAYVYMMIEALADGGVKVGLPREMALKLAAQTVFGSAKMVLETGTHPAILKDAVASPAGTTIEGILALEQGGLRAAVMNAVVVASQRAAELGKKG
jgi:pyrroline-5-carboxylate reductase